LLIDGDDESQILQCGAASLNGDTLGLGQGETGCGYGDDIETGRKLRELVGTIGTGLYGCRGSILSTLRQGATRIAVWLRRDLHTVVPGRLEIFASDHSCIMRLLVDAIFRRHPGDRACGHNE